ncbi:hypothetical protein KL928_003065 [Ogataea angusta]|uniref:Dol-P-Glc:Glc(2)Man(9)GlcNAc(2)-PP-Dol alpha-1,2-glucosyltransferase n=1 Tax=Pichia angusta TaxID=870730 RepID=A0AAN6I606_PICAN|nr:uncharacterized protein KL928_003065 [Ogataea angusta]KAG7818064.1 hypothetical protein KL928_003065 [Ogataea angusta]
MDTVPDVALAAIGVSTFKPYFDQANELVNYTFIDEIFHVNQVKEYWNGNFDSWDSKITTPPGLYYLAYWWLKLTGLEFSIANLRLLNLFGGVLLIITTLVVKKRYNPGLSALSLFSSPLLTIYYTLFYTDIWSTILIVQSFVAAVSVRPTLTSATLSCLLGSISLLIIILLFLIWLRCFTALHSLPAFRLHCGSVRHLLEVTLIHCSPESIWYSIVSGFS